MRLQPRQHLLEIWRATTQVSYRPTASASGEQWIWGGREATDSISDAKQLLCVMLPATALPRFRVDSPDQTEDDVLAALRQLGSAPRIPQILVRVLTDYMIRYVDEAGDPVFTGGGYVVAVQSGQEPTTEQNAYDVVESFAVSVSLTLAVLSFTKRFRSHLTRTDLLKQTDELERLAGRRLSAAMAGLLRSYCISAFDVDEPRGSTLLGILNQAGMPRRQVVEELHAELRDTAAGLRDLLAGTESDIDIERPNSLFECGWSWAPTRDPSLFDRSWGADSSRARVAEAAPHLYFTAVALNGIAELFSERTRLQGLLDEEQQRLAAALRLRHDLTQRYWATVASFGTGRWPLEDIPWRTVDAEESDLYSLLIGSIAVTDLAQARGNDVVLSRLGRVLGELASRARITRRPVRNDPALQLHEPGVLLPLHGSEAQGPALGWTVSDFAPLLLIQAIKIATLINQIEGRGQILVLVDEVWDHVAARRIRDRDVYRSGSSLWDQPSEVFPAIPRRFDQPSWHFTLRVVESLVAAADLTDSQPLRSEPLVSLALALLAEAEHLFDQELLAGSTESSRPMRQVLERVRQRLRRAREVIEDRPGSAVTLVMTCLRDLDGLSAARSDVTGR